MKTAMQELLEELNGESFKELCSNHKYIKDYLESRIKLAYIEREKRQIKLNWIEGKETEGFGNTVFEDAEFYYNKKYVESES